MAFNTAAFFIFWFVLYLLFLAGGKSNSWKIGILLIGNLFFFHLAYRVCGVNFTSSVCA